MAEITLKSVSFPVLQLSIINATWDNEQIQLIDHACRIEKTDAGNIFKGKRKLEMRKLSEAHSDHKTFYIEIEAEGMFIAEMENIDSSDVKREVRKILFPYLFEKLKSLLTVAGIQIDFVAEGVLNELDGCVNL